MKLSRKIAVGVIVVALIAATAALTSLAEGTYGSRSDPLVTLSYINQTVVPDVKAELDRQLDERVAELEKEFESRLGELRSGEVADSERFAVVSLTSGQTLRCSVGTELLLRIGTCVTAGDNSPRLVDETTGTEISASGEELTKNHMYMVTIKDNGVRATSSVKILVKGEYTVA